MAFSLYIFVELRLNLIFLIKERKKKELRNGK